MTATVQPRPGQPRPGQSRAGQMRRSAHGSDRYGNDLYGNDPSASRFNEGVFPRYERASPGSDFHAGGALRSVDGRSADGRSVDGRWPGQRPGWSVPDQIYLPPGWPEQVLPPETPDWEQSATAYLLDCCPADYRGHQVLRRHPVVLARLAAEFVESQIRASRDAMASARAGLGEYVSADVLDGTVEVVQSELARLAIVRRGVMLVEEALRGRVFIRKL